MKIETPSKAVFSVECRQVYGKSEWILVVQIDDGNEWVLMAWDYEPDAEECDEIKKLVKRSFEVYHAHLKIPRFDADFVDGD